MTSRKLQLERQKKRFVEEEKPTVIQEEKEDYKRIKKDDWNKNYKQTYNWMQGKVCNYCGGINHREKYCYKKKNDQIKNKNINRIGKNSNQTNNISEKPQEVVRSAGSIGL